MMYLLNVFVDIILQEKLKTLKTIKVLSTFEISILLK